MSNKSLLDWIMQTAIVSIALVIITLLAVLLAGCTTLGYEQKAAASAQAKGCYCAGKGCREIKSAAGEAAVAAAGGQVVNITEVSRRETP